MCVEQGKYGQTNTHDDGTCLNGLHPADAAVLMDILNNKDGLILT
jgi:hypothetical protein